MIATLLVWFWFSFGPRFGSFVTVGYWITLPILLWRVNVGPIQLGFIFWLRVFVINFMLFMTILPLLQYYTIKFLAIVVKKRMVSTLDDFWSQSLFRINVTVSVIPTYLTLFTKVSYDRVKTFQGLPEFLSEAPIFECRYAIL